MILLFIILLNNISKTKKEFHKIKVCLCVIAKNEHLYINEFVEYYSKIGYNHIFIYDNNEIDGESYENIIKKYIKKGFVSIINYRGRINNTRPIFDAYKDCYEKNNLKYDWLSFFDMDEFLELKPIGLKIQNFLNNKKFEKCQNIKINWLIFNNPNSLFYENKPLQQRINIADFNSPLNKHIKSTVRGKLIKNYWFNIINPHSSYDNFTACSSSGKIIDSYSPFNEPAEYSYAYLKHYYYKSFEEFCIKIYRGRCDVSVKDSNNFKLGLIKNIYLENRGNKDKLKIMEKIFKTDLNKIKDIQ